MSAVPAVAEPVLGSVLPRIATPPLVVGDPGPCVDGCALTPENSYGWDVIDFARDVLRTPLDPWQEYLVIHAGELLQDGTGRPRFRTVLAIVPRQNGKSLLARVLILYWMFIERHPVTLATSTNRGYAKKAWEATVEVAKRNAHLAAELPARPTVLQIGEEDLRTIHDTHYYFAAVNRDTGRSLTINRLVLDEIRQHQNFDAWGASTNAMNAVPDGQIWAVSNQGDDTSVVLDWLRDAALAYLDTGVGDRRLGAFEWSAPPGSAPDDIAAICMANPNAGRRLDLESLLGQAKQALSGDSQALTSFKTEVLCMRVDKLDPAIDPQAWRAASTDAPTPLASHRDRLALCLDVSLDGLHASLVAAAVLDDARVHVEVVEAWSGRDCTQRLRAELPGIVTRVRPRVLGWFPNGPAAAVAAALAERKGTAVRWPPPRVTVEEIRGDVPAVCMGLVDVVTATELVHPDDPMLNSHSAAAQKLPRGDAWVFGRKGSGPIDGTYALAGAVHLARTLTIPPKLRVVTRKGTRANSGAPNTV